MPPQSTDWDPERLAAVLRALGSPVRLRLLLAIQRPKAVRDIHLESGRPVAGRPSRAMSRQALRRHLDGLVAIGVVQVRAARAGQAREAYQVDVQQLFALTEQTRVLASLEQEAPGGDATMAAEPLRPPPAPGVPHLVLVKGVGEGRRFFLEGPGPWSVGRQRDLDVCLDYDPYVSGRHCVLERDADAGRLRVRDLRSRNGTAVGFSRLGGGASRPLAAGDVLQVGRSVLVVQLPA